MTKKSRKKVTIVSLTKRNEQTDSSGLAKRVLLFAFPVIAAGFTVNFFGAELNVMLGQVWEWSISQIASMI